MLSFVLLGGGVDFSQMLSESSCYPHYKYSVYLLIPFIGNRMGYGLGCGCKETVMMWDSQGILAAARHQRHFTALLVTLSVPAWE